MDPKALQRLKESFSIFYLLFHLVGNKPALAAATPKMEDCEPMRCGNSFYITFPFWISGKQQPHCGYPPFKLTCGKNDSYPYAIEILDFKYYVLNISYDNQSFLVNLGEFVDETCPLPPTNLTVNSSLYPLGISPNNTQIYFLVNCSSDPVGLEYKRIACATVQMAYYGGLYDGLNQRDLGNTSCALRIVPVKRNSEANKDDYSALLRSGMLVNWTSPDCAPCQKSGGSCGYNEANANFMCICPDQVQPYSCNSPTNRARGKNTNNMKKIIIGISSAGTSLLCLFLLVCILCCRKSHENNMQSFDAFLHQYVYIICCSKSRKDNEQSVEAFLRQHGSLAPKRYKYSEIKRMTKSFKNKLGQGGYGSVFKGTLQDGRLVAVKILSESKGDGEEFINEVASISRTSHVNVVSLLGFCLEGSKRALVYEFMPNGSLEKFVHSDKSDKSSTETQFDCEKLYEIALGIARGLEYLHGGCNTRIVHFDIKPQNILLDQDFCPKISDFGLAKLCPQKESIISMAVVRGTIGYIAPEVYSRNFGFVSAKSDVYSYGMMLLEIVGGRDKIIVTNENTNSETYFPHWLYDNLDRYCKLSISSVTSETEEIVRKMIIIGLWCIQMMPENRPSMSKVVEMLKGSAKDLQLPPRPREISTFILSNSLDRSTME